MIPPVAKGAKRLFILGIDGVPLSLIKRAFARGRMPHLRRLAEESSLVRLSSVIPVVSQVAWATFSTGVNPARHGITGFVDRDPRLNTVLLTSRELQAKSLWKRLNGHGRRVIAVNVPGTYPPEPADGVIVGGFLSPSLEQAVHPPTLGPLLRELDDIIDPGPRLAHTDKRAFMDQIFRALEARRALAVRLLERESWDVFMLHVMETDRVNHFYWEAQDDPDHPFHQAFWELYRRVDALAGELSEALGEDTELMVLSDHGFSGVRREVDLNAYLAEREVLRFKDGAQALVDLDPSSVAYSLTPGRIYLNLRGRENLGRVTPQEAPGLLAELTQALSELADPETGERVIRSVHRREELYRGPLMDRMPELVAHPVDGYDLKAGVPHRGDRPVAPATVRTGMHTLEDAFLLVRGRRLDADGEASILDVTPTIFALLGLTIPEAFEGRSLVRP